jgi:sarcosine oxidase subunit beta
MGSRLLFLEEMARGMIEVIPRFAELKVVRQWAGPYDLTEDGQPIVGEAPGVPGFYLCCGFMGHGFMMAPVVSRILANHLVDGTDFDLFRRWGLDRFGKGELAPETMIIG